MTATQAFYWPYVIIPRHLRHKPEVFADCIIFGGVAVYRRAVQESYREPKRRLRRKLHRKP